MIALSGVAKAHGTRTLFRDVSLQLVPGRRIALVGANGTGKTTLLSLITGEQQPDAGEVSRHKDARVALLPQEVALTRGRTVLEEVLRGADETTDVQRQLRELEDGIAAASDDAQRERLVAQYGDLQHRFETLGGYGLEGEAHRILAGLGFAADDAERDVGELSGGWMMRVALARLLLADPDVLLLDEPTNHLDLDSVTWLERQLVERSGALLFVSHDRDFIDAVANRVVELWAGTTTEYVVDGFGAYVEQREERLEQLEAAARNQARKVAQTERFIERFRYKASKARQVQSRVKALDRLATVDVPRDEDRTARFAFPEPQRAGRVLVELTDVTAAYGDDLVFTGADLTVERGDRVALVGPNGAGKTTLLKLLAGQLDAAAGTREVGHNVEIATFAQHQVDALDLQRTVLAEYRDGLPERHAQRNHRTTLGAFGFTGEAAEQPVGTLSGGERARLALAKVCARAANLLLLDEPTNHLDIGSRDVLEDALLAYPGTVVLITHDRHLIRAVADTIVEVHRGTVRRFPGGLDDYLERTGRLPTATRRESPGATDGRDADDVRSRKRAEAELRNRLYRETKGLRAEVERLEASLVAAEDEVARLTRALADPSAYEDAGTARELVAAHGAAKDRAAELMRRWERAATELERVTAAVEAEAAGSRA